MQSVRMISLLAFKREGVKPDSLEHHLESTFSTKITRIQMFECEELHQIINDNELVKYRHLSMANQTK
ncbi:hypothetical protein DERF_005936 [Dermatophagoides farinae]|uniref:Uncharacterized protein n=1 Tax=Dermatophagoides farinae TaxID=6954 RepID=A0A922L972_DERFA|nr:hypothetical protein DERF_005936 [Dermatophagoides farinae]